MPITTHGDSHSGYIQYGESGKKYEYGPGKRFKSREKAYDAARKQEIAINLSQERAGKTPEWDK